MRKGILVSVVIAILSMILFQVVLAENLKEKNIYIELQDKIKKFDPKNEIVRLRTENRRTFKDKNGKMVTFISTEPLNYRDDDNQLQPIELNLASEKSVKVAPRSFAAGVSSQQRPAGNGFRYKHHALKNSVKARFAETSDGGTQLERQGYTLEFVLKNQKKSRGTINKNKIKYAKVLDNCDLVYTILPGQIKDELIFYSVPKTPVISYKLKINNRLKPKNGPEGSINLVDASGNIIFNLSPSVVYEKDDEEQFKEIETKFHWEGNELYCDLVLDLSWFKDKKRKYPVVIDPMVAPIPTSYGKEPNRTLIHCPEQWGQIKCTIKLDGPGWHGDASDHDRAEVYFKDKTIGEVIFHHRDVSGFDEKTFVRNIEANHDYEIYLYGGRTRRIDGKKYYGSAWATVEYGGENGHLFEIDVEKTSSHFTGITDFIVSKNIYIKYPQKVKYKYILEPSKSDISMPMTPYFRISPGPHIPPPVSGEVLGEILLNPGDYRFELSPSNKNHYRVELEFPLGTGHYEKKVVLRTNPGSIESTFMIPSSKEVLLEYRTFRNGNPSNEAYPTISITSESGATVFPPIRFPLDYYNVYDGGSKVFLEKEKLYTLTVSRGRNGSSGWGGINLDLYYPLNKSCRVEKIGFIDEIGNPVAGFYGGKDYQLRFSYQDDENHTLKSYKLLVNGKEYNFDTINIDNGWVTIPYHISDFKLNSGTTFNCKIEAYDGFDIGNSGLENFTVDSTPPEIERFSGEVVTNEGNNTINLVCEAQDRFSGIQNGTISWKINGEFGGSKPWITKTESITGLPNNAQVEITFSVTDNVNNTASLTSTFYTQPEKSSLVAPQKIYTNKPGKYHPTLKFTKANASEYRIQRYLKQDSQPDELEYDTGFMDSDSLATVTMFPPGLNIISPKSGTSFGRPFGGPAYITITAYCDNLESDIYKVDFYVNGKLIGTDTCSPFSKMWSTEKPGFYELTAVATDTDGLTQTSPPVTIEVTNEHPTVRIISPVSGDSYPQPARIIIRAEAYDSDSDISKVEFFNGNNLIDTSITSPYSIILENVPYGNYTFTAKATDSDGAVTVSDPVSIYVTNVPPTVAIADLEINEPLIAPANITIKIDDEKTADSDGTIERIDFYADGSWIGQDNSAPYSFTWLNAPVGRHALKVKAVDNNGAETWSNEVYVDIYPSPDNMWYGWITIADGYDGIRRLGHWEELKKWDNANDSGFQWLINYNYPSKLWINGAYVDVFAYITTYYWVPRNITVTNYSQNDDYFYIYVNDVLQFFDDWSGERVDWNKPIVLSLKGGQWNKVHMTLDNRGSRYFQLGFPNNFKYLIQQALNASGGGTVYMCSDPYLSAGTSTIMNQETTAGQDGYFESVFKETSSIKAFNESVPSNGSNPECYAFVDLLPVNPHQTYVYRITTRNGDQTVEYESDSIPVMNNVPEIMSLEPGEVSYSNGAFNLRVTNVRDYDGDELKFSYILKDSNGDIAAKKENTSEREFNITGLAAGTYTWTVTVKDDFGGEAKATGTVKVDKEIPTALFSINNSALYTTKQSVDLKVTNASENVDKIRISNDKQTWTEYSGGNQTINHWELTPEDGPKTVYLQAHKEAGDTWGPVVERSIILDTTKPEVAYFQISNEGGDGKVTFHWAGGKDNMSGLSGKVNIERWNNGFWVKLETSYAGNRIEIPAAGYNTEVKIRLQLSDNAGNLSDWVEAVGYTKAAPGSINLLESVGGFSEIEGHYISLKLNPAEGAVKYKVECVQNPGGGSSAFVGSDLTYKDTGVLPHQTYKYKVLTFNSNDEITEGPAGEITVANTPPVKPAGTGPMGLLNRLEGLSFTFDNPVDLLDPDGDEIDVTFHLSSDGINYQDLETNIPEGLSEGVTYWWKATLDDGHGGSVTTEPVSFSIDATKPVITVDNMSVEYAPEHRVRISVSDSGSGVKTLRVNGIEIIGTTNEVTFNTQGVNYLTVEAIDLAGNIETFSHRYYVDQTPPDSRNLRFDLPERGGSYLAGQNLIPVVWEAVDPETGVAKFYYAWSGNGQSFNPENMKEISLLGEQGSYLQNILGDFEDGQVYYLHLQAENYLGQKGAIIQSPPLLHDHTGPVLSIGELYGGRLFSGIYYLSSLRKLEFAVNADDPHTGISKLEYALVTDKSQVPQWFETLDALYDNSVTIDGQIYYLAVRATNGTNLTTTVYSQPLVVDGSAPTLTVTTQPEQQDNRTYRAIVATNDPHTMVIKAQYGIGSTAGATDLSKGLPGADADGWITIEYPSNIFEVRQYAELAIGAKYYFTVKSTNISGVTGVKSSEGTTVIGCKAPIVRDDGNYTSDQNSLHFEWSFPNNTRQITGYRYRIRTEAGIVKDWSDITETAVIVKKSQLATQQIEDKTTYFCDVVAVYEDGSNSEIGSSDGILTDFTLPEITAWKIPRYASADGIKLEWNATDPESGVKCYAGIGASPGGNEITKGWIYLGNLNKFMLSQDQTGATIPFTHNAKYYVTIMAENGAGLTVQQTGEPVLMDLTPPEPPVVIDEGNYTNRNDRLKFSWKWPIGDPESGIREYWYTLTTQKALSGGEQWFTSLQMKEVLLDELELLQGGTYYLAVKAINNADAESIGFSDGIMVDVTAPTPPVVVDYGDFSLKNNELDVSVVASDAESGVAEYKLSLGTYDNPDVIFKDRKVLSEGGQEELKLAPLSLEEGQVYYFRVSAINNAGIESMVSYSDGIMVDSIPPQVETVTVQGRYLTDPTRIVFDWSVKPTPSGIIDAQYAISENPNGAGLEWQPADLSGSQTVTGLNLIEGKTYYVYVRVQNRALAENTPSLWSVPVRSNPIALDTTPPEIINIHAPALMPRRFLLQWEARDDVSGIAEYRYAIGSYRGGTDVTGGWVSLVTDKTTVSFYRDDLALYDNHDYYISVAAKNGAGLWSPVYKSEAIKTELTPPVVSNLSYSSNYFNLQDQQKGVSIYWAANDEQSGIAAYRVKLVTTKDDQDLDTAAVLTNQTSGVIHLTNLSLTDGQIYYVAFQAQNGIGAWSEVKYSAAILADLTPPVVSIVKNQPEFVTNDGQLSMTWRVTEASNLTYRLTYPNGYQTEPGTIPVTDEYIHQFTLPEEIEGNYSLVLEPVDLAGNPGVMVLENIRLNAKPIANPGPERRVFKGKTVAFEPEASDSDGTVVEYFWDFGNGETSTEVKPSCTYRELGTYTVTLKVRDNDGKWSEPGTTHVTVTNTASGELTMDEDWEGEASISGDLIVPKGITLRLKPGTKMDFTGKYKVLVYGKILIEGTSGNPIVIGANTDAWDGIRLINSEAGSLIRCAEIHSASAGLVVSESELSIENCLFKGNRIGLHILKASPTVKSCTFEENLIYGVKEDDQATPTMKDCRFINNLTVDYYEDELGIIDMERLNKLGQNERNTKTD